MKSRHKPEPDLWEGMSHKQYATLCRYVSQAADLLQLQNWEIHLSKKPCPNPEAAAQVFIDFGCRSAHIEVSYVWNEYTQEKKREYVAHELIHCLERPIFDMLEKILRTAIGELGWNILEPALRQQRELMVESLSVIAAKTLPVYPQ